MEEIRESRKSMEQERVAHLPPQKNEVLESILKVGWRLQSDHMHVSAAREGQGSGGEELRPRVRVRSRV